MTWRISPTPTLEKVAHASLPELVVQEAEKVAPGKMILSSDLTQHSKGRVYNDFM